MFEIMLTDANLYKLDGVIDVITVMPNEGLTGANVRNIIMLNV